MSEFFCTSLVRKNDEIAPEGRKYFRYRFVFKGCNHNFAALNFYPIDMAKKNTVAEPETTAYTTAKKAETVVEKAVEKPAFSADALLEKTRQFFTDTKNRNFILIALGGLLLLAGGFVGFGFWKKSRNEEAQKYMYPAVFSLEKDSLKVALNGSSRDDGLLKIADDYSMTDAGNLANFYAGAGLLKEGKFDEAIERLSKFSASDRLLQARAYCLIGDAWSEKNEFDKAADFYQKAATYKPNKFFTPQYLMKLALVQEKKKDLDGALKSYTEIADQYSESAEAANARKYKARLESLTGK